MMWIQQRVGELNQNLQLTWYWCVSFTCCIKVKDRVQLVEMTSLSSCCYCWYNLVIMNIGDLVYKICIYNVYNVFTLYVKFLLNCKCLLYVRRIMHFRQSRRVTWREPRYTRRILSDRRIRHWTTDEWVLVLMLLQLVFRLPSPPNRFDAVRRLFYLIRN